MPPITACAPRILLTVAASLRWCTKFGYTPSATITTTSGAIASQVQP